MKKIISVFLCALMLAAMFCLPASAANELAKGYDAAKDGELLYDVVFNAKDGAYTPDVISRDTDKNTTADVKFSAMVRKLRSPTTMLMSEDTGGEDRSKVLNSAKAKIIRLPVR